MKNNKKSKIVLFSVIGLAAISIGTVGFATWITGIVDKEETSDISVTVDTSKNTTCILEVNQTDSAIHLGENITSEGNKIYTQGGTAEDLKISFNKFRVIATSDFTISSIDLKITAISNNETNPLDITTSGLGVAKRGESKSYIDLKVGKITSIPTPADGADKLQGYKIYDFTTGNNFDIEFKWGELFNYKSPSTYYNGLLTSDLTTEDKLEIMNNANTTLNEMNTYFKYGVDLFKGLTITATVVTEPAA